ncbi:MAG: GNAT family N-acetyltransferase [Deltaproteobacteria bacterium]|nr:GNAT family N-acetyltransferase [Deltaproteobacteria bacterium]
MANAAEKTNAGADEFGEKHFYLDEFRGHTLLFSVPAEQLVREDELAPVANVVRDLLANDTRVILLVGAADDQGAAQTLRRLQRRFGPQVFREETFSLFPQRRHRSGAFVELPPDALYANTSTELLSRIWLTLRHAPLFVGIVRGAGMGELTSMAQRVATRLRVHKLVLLEAAGGVEGNDGKAISFMNDAMLETLLGVGEAEWAGLSDRRPTFEAVHRALLGGVASVNLCPPAGAPHELFTYTGSGTLFTLADYCTVQPLGIDEFEEVERLIERGQQEGLLKPRSPEEVAAMLVNGYGATIGAHHLAGICALATEPYAGARAGEIVGLYTITRFKGEGIGSRLIARAVADARAAQLDYVFACTTEERALVFFEREGFRRVGPDAIPTNKWAGYDAVRRERVFVLRMDLK